MAPALCVGLEGVVLAFDERFSCNLFSGACVRASAEGVVLAVDERFSCNLFSGACVCVRAEGVK